MFVNKILSLIFIKSTFQGPSGYLKPTWISMYYFPLWLLRNQGTVSSGISLQSKPSHQIESWLGVLIFLSTCSFMWYAGCCNGCTLALALISSPHTPISTLALEITAIPGTHLSLFRMPLLLPPKSSFYRFLLILQGPVEPLPFFWKSVSLPCPRWVRHSFWLH